MENTLEEQTFAVNRLRDNWLAVSEMVKINSTDEEKVLWNEFQQSLNSVSTQAGFPWSIDWPKPPNNKLPPNTYEVTNV